MRGGNHPLRFLASKHGLFVSSISVLAIFSILEFDGKLRVFVDIEDNYNKLPGSFDTKNGTYNGDWEEANRDASSKDDFVRLDSGTIGNSRKSHLEATTDASSGDSSRPRHDESNEKQTEQSAGANRHQRGDKSLEVAWLMSFPNSGTTYTNHLIQDYTRTTTATNYGQEQDTKEDSISLFKDSIDGPFFRYTTWSLPPKYILTKTHCGGECDACQTPGRKQYNNTLEAFEVSCRTGKRIFNRTKVKTTYSPDIPKRAVHLIRNPFDNIVARLHLKERRWARSNNAKYEERVEVFNKTKEGFRAYCRFRDTDSFKQERRHGILSKELLQYAQQVPCYGEFIAYTEWHNHAVSLIEKKGIPFLTLFYEDYASNWNETVDRLLTFLSLTPAKGAKAEEFIRGKHYDEFYDEKEKLAATKLIQAFSSVELWKLLQRYFL